MQPMAGWGFWCVARRERPVETNPHHRGAWPVWCPRGTCVSAPGQVRAHLAAQEPGFNASLGSSQAGDDPARCFVPRFDPLQRTAQVKK